MKHLSTCLCAVLCAVWALLVLLPPGAFAKGKTGDVYVENAAPKKARYIRPNTERIAAKALRDPGRLQRDPKVNTQRNAVQKGAKKTGHEVLRQ